MHFLNTTITGLPSEYALTWFNFDKVAFSFSIPVYQSIQTNVSTMPCHIHGTHRMNCKNFGYPFTSSSGKINQFLWFIAVENSALNFRINISFISLNTIFCTALCSLVPFFPHEKGKLDDLPFSLELRHCVRVSTYMLRFVCVKLWVCLTWRMSPIRQTGPRSYKQHSQSKP